jgi:ketosteroid isomerase-like protein
MRTARNRALRLAAISALLGSVGWTAGASELPGPRAATVAKRNEAAETRIREERARSNDAIARHDLEALEATWVDDLEVTASSGRVVTNGAEMKQLFAGAFSDPQFEVYVRTPEKVQIGPGGGLAAESGEWTGRWKKPDGEMVVRGTYLAQWRKVGDDWRIRSELYVALGCEGSSACSELP